MKQQRIYCSGLWFITGNRKRSLDHYITLLPHTLNMIGGQKLRFFSDDYQTLDKVETLCRERNIDFDGIHRKVSELPAWGISQKLLHGCKQMNLDLFSKPKVLNKEKGVKHYWRDLKGGGDDVYRGVLSVWLSKVALAESLAAEQEATSMTCWIDASVSRFNNACRNWDFSIVQAPAGKVSHYTTGMCYYGEKLPLNASFLCADPQTWKKLLTEFNVNAELAAKMPYGHDEETILGECLRKLPHLFHCISFQTNNEPAWHQRSLKIIKSLPSRLLGR